MNDNVGQQRLHATEQRVSSAGEQPSVATRVAAAQEGPDETMRQALAASSAKEASAASDADVVEKNQMGGEKLVLLIGSPMCQTSRGVITTMMRDADYKNFVEQCVKRPEEKGMYEIQRNEGRSCMRIYATGGLVDSASSRRWRRVLARVERRMSCADLSRQRVLRGQDLVSSRNQSTSPRSWACVAATKRSGPRFT